MRRREKFFAATLKEALAKVERRFGEDALILSTRYVERRGWLGLRSEKWVEVEAEGKVQKDSTNPRMMADVRELVHETVMSVLRQQKVEQDPLCAQLERRGFSKAFAQHLASQLSHRGVQSLEDSQGLARLEELLCESIPVCREPEAFGKGTFWAFVGPTGVGKTTTIAKLAARFQLERNLRVGLCTLDTYRVGAVDQLRTYANILKIPLVVVQKVQEIQKAKKELSQYDLVLVDTAGRSQRDVPKMNELAEFLQLLEADAVHLVFSANTRRRGLEDLLERFLPLGAHCAVITKLDEGGNFAEITSLLWENRLAVKYLTNGQDVPEDLLEALPRRLVMLALSSGSLAHE